MRPQKMAIKGRCGGCLPHNIQIIYALKNPLISEERFTN